jgi:plasmid stabilization system protein ParE
MSRVILTRLAQADLVEIGRFIARDNEAAARRWVRKLRTTCKKTIGGMPECGTWFDYLLPGMRCF